MKSSKLLATTALVASASIFAAAPASAAELKLGGYYEQWFGFAGSGQPAGVTEPHSDFDIQQDAEIFFNFKQKLSNGLTVGGRFEMEAQEGDSGGLDESSMYVSGSFGKIQIGSNDVAASGAGGVSVVGPVGVIKSDAKGKWFGGMGLTMNTDNDLGMSDEQNITYTTPKMNGLQLALTHTPENSGASARATTGFTDGFSSLVKYSTKMGGTGVTLGLGYTSNESAASSGSNQDGINVGLKVTSGAMTITAAYMKEDLASTDETFNGVGLIYKLDKVNSISLGYGNHEKKTISSGATQDETVITGGVSRNLGNGVSAQASVFYGEREDSAASSNDMDDTGLVAGFKVRF